jgi:hypothetical protein
MTYDRRASAVDQPVGMAGEKIVIHVAVGQEFSSGGGHDAGPGNAHGMVVLVVDVVCVKLTKGGKAIGKWVVLGKMKGRFAGDPGCEGWCGVYGQPIPL